MPVNTVEGKLGKVARVVVNRELREITHLVVRRGIFFAEQLVIPMAMIGDVHEAGILVTGGDEVLANLRGYNELSQAVTKE